MAQDSPEKGLDEELAASGAAMDCHCCGLQLPCDAQNVIVERCCPLTRIAHGLLAVRMTALQQRAAAAKPRGCGLVPLMTELPGQLSCAATRQQCPPTIPRAPVTTDQAPGPRRQRDIWRRPAKSTRTATHRLRMPARAPLTVMPRTLRLQSQRRKDRSGLKTGLGAG